MKKIRSRRKEEWIAEMYIFEGNNNQYLLSQSDMNALKIIPQH
jgi:hypothetical protein